MASRFGGVVSLDATVDLVGIVPAAGTGSRLGKPGQLKELLPVWVDAAGRTAPACACLLSSFASAAVRRTVVVTRPGKNGLREALGRTAYGVELEYLVADRLDGPPYTIDRAFDEVRASIVAIGFPDILFEAPDPFGLLIERLRSESFDAVLGMFPIAPGQKADRVTVDGDGRLQRIDPRADRDDPRPTWALAAWSPGFSRYVHELLIERPATEIGQPEPVVGDILGAALADGLSIGAEFVSRRPFLDIGTPAGLASAYVAIGKEESEA